MLLALSGCSEDSAERALEPGPSAVSGVDAGTGVGGAGDVGPARDAGEQANTGERDAGDAGKRDASAADATLNTAPVMADATTDAGSVLDAGSATSADPGAQSAPDAGQGASDFVEDHRAECTIASMPVAASLENIATLPDPFTMMDGTPVTTRAQWQCRREELGAMLEHYELGEKPRAPTSVSGAMSGQTLTITVTDQGKSITFTVAITKPAGTGPFPAVIGYGSVNLGTALWGSVSRPSTTPPPTTFNPSASNQMAKDGSQYRGQGLFYDLYGSDHEAGSLMAWAWGASRILDALIATPEAGIDPTRVAVTGCSRFGKGALVAGAFDQRIALTIPQEGGSGGCSAWRAIAYVKSQGSDIEQLSNVAGGRIGSAPASAPTSVIRPSTASRTITTSSPGMIAPRALLNVEQDGIAWLGPAATHINNVAAREVFTALGAEDAHTYTLSGGHDHCILPMSQHHWVESYVKKYLHGQEGEAAAIEVTPGHTVERARWIDWTTPTLR